jgi:linoleoyl-CoA desaturase
MDTTTATTATQPTVERDERLRRFGDEIDAIRDRIEAKVGDEDVRYVRRLNRFSRLMEAIGRVLLHVSFEPITFTLGVLSLWVHKQLQATEIGHTALHGAYDRLKGAEAFHSKTFSWDVPIDEESWRAGHNVKHHQYTNIAGRDPDVHFGPVRLTEDVPHAKHHRWQLPFVLLVLFPNFAFFMNMHFTGLHDVVAGGNSFGGLDVLPDRSPANIRRAWWRTIRKYAPYYLKNYVLFPALAGPGWWKVLLGNWLAETMRDVYSAATIFCGHVGGEVASYQEGT